jgi:hypothetical protein
MGDAPAEANSAKVTKKLTAQFFKLFRSKVGKAEVRHGWIVRR